MTSLIALENRFCSQCVPQTKDLKEALRDKNAEIRYTLPRHRQTVL